MAKIHLGVHGELLVATLETCPKCGSTAVINAGGPITTLMCWGNARINIVEDNRGVWGDPNTIRQVQKCCGCSHEWQVAWIPNEGRPWLEEIQPRVENVVGNRINTNQVQAD